MVTRILIVTFCLTGCGDAGPILGVTKCGMVVRGPAEVGFFEDTQRLETETVRAFQTPPVIAYDARFADVCPLLHGWNVYQVQATHFTAVSGVDAAGETNCDVGAVLVANKHLDPSARMEDGKWVSGPSSAFPHELGHVVQRCTIPRNTPYDPGGDADHQGWGVISDAITKYVDPL